MTDDTALLDRAERIARAIRQALARGIVQSNGEYLRIEDAATYDLAEHIAAALREAATVDPDALDVLQRRVGLTE